MTPPTPRRLARPADLARLADAASAAPFLVLDTEFHAEHRYRPLLLLVQVHVPGGDTWLLDPLEAGLLEGAAPTLLSKPWLLHAGQMDLPLLHERLGDVPDTVFDTQIAAGLLTDDYPAGLAKLCAAWINLPVDKGATLTDWSRRPLSAEQLAYAAADVETLPALWAALTGALVARGRGELVEGACAEARKLALTPRDPDEAWREIPGAAQLAPADAMVLQELAVWREELARAQDQQPRSVISDGLLLQFAKRKPSTPGELLNRRVPRALIKEHGAAIVERVQRAGRRPDWAWPVYVRSNTPLARSAALLSLIIAHEGAMAGWSARLVLPEALVSTLLLSAPASRHALTEQLGPWRDALVGDRLWAALGGRIALRVSPEPGASLELIPL